MAKPNYSFEKKQRELAKKKKQDEKAARKQSAKEPVIESVEDSTSLPSPVSGEPNSPSGS